VIVLVNNLYTVFVRAIGLWFIRIVASDFLYNNMVWLFFQKAGIFYSVDLLGIGIPNSLKLV
jgi:hypothetical protein